MVESSFKNIHCIEKVLHKCLGAFAVNPPLNALAHVVIGCNIPHLKCCWLAAPREPAPFQHKLGVPRLF